MDLQLIREKLRLERPLGVGRSQALVTGEVTLPGGLREETHVLAALATASVEQAEAAQGRVSVRGRVMFHVLYTQGEPSRVHAIEASADFMQPVDMPDVQSRAAAQAQVQVGRVEARANGGRLNLRAEVDVTARATALEPVEAIMAIEGSDDVQVRSCGRSILRTAAAGSADMLLREEIALPDNLMITETLFSGAYPVVEAVTGGMGRVGMSGQVLLEAVHASALPGRPVVVTRHSIPFAHSVEINGEEGEKLSGTAIVRDVAVASKDDGEGVSMRAEILLGMEARAEVAETIDLMDDAYTLAGEGLRLSGESVHCRTSSWLASEAESGKTTFILPEGAPPVRTMLLALVRPQPEQKENHAGRTMISGTLDTTLLYMTDDSPAPVSLRLTEPFRVTYQQETPEDALVTLAATDVEAVPVTSDRVELRYILRMQAVCEESQEIRLLTAGEIVEEEPVTEDIVLCFVQPGEQLWDVARRYRVPVESVRALNPDMKDEVAPGQGLVIWRRMAAQ